MNTGTSMDEPVTLVMVHGVGDAKPGAILADFSKALKASHPESAFHQENLFIGGFSYSRFVGRHARFAGRAIREMIEVNWADVLRPGDGKAGILNHYLHLFFALRNLSLAAKTNPAPIARSCARFCWNVLELVCLWIALGTMGLIVLASMEVSGWKCAATASGMALVFGALAEAGAWTRRTRYRWGWLWALVFLVLAWRFGNQATEMRTAMIETSAKIYAGSQAIGSTCLTVAFFSSVLAGGGSLAQRAARGAYLWLPFLLGTSMLVLLWLILLGTTTHMHSVFPSAIHWQTEFVKALPYDLKTAEMAMMGAQAVLFVAVPLFGLLVYFSKTARRFLGFPRLPGSAAHQMVEVFLIAGPAVLLACSAVILCWGMGTNQAGSATMLNTYQLSALRIPALLTFLLPGLRTLGDIVGDVLFHIQPRNSEVISRRATRERLSLLLDLLKDREGTRPVMLISHSQGSVISWTLLNHEPRLADTLITVGSPLSTLYARFLGGEFREPYALDMEWHNLYRSGDYVGGAITGCPDNLCIGPGVHTDYWSDPHFVQTLEARLTNTQSSSPISPLP